MKQSLNHHLEHGIPFSDFGDTIHTPELKVRIADAQEASLLAHQDMYDGFHNADPRVLSLDDPFSGEKAKYITLADTDGKPLYGQWDEANPATDIGIRGIHPHFRGVTNVTTVLHADSAAAKDFYERGAPATVIEAMHAIGLLNKFVVVQVVLPFLGRVAALDGIDAEAYRSNFYRPGARACTLTRSILYHLANGQQPQPPVGTDGKRLLIKEHYDQSSYSVDAHQTASGLQYRVGEDWVDAGTEIAVFRGKGEDFRTQEAPSALHRVINGQNMLTDIDPNLLAAGIGRIANITFVSPSVANARVVRPSSPETHPTEHVNA